MEFAGNSLPPSFNTEKKQDDNDETYQSKIHLFYCNYYTHFIDNPYCWCT
uniref:Uncharacterized protein n=1 Tax=Arion vulgaris TaxID=1028688 RepID=A0A0B7AZV9_9EUPU